MNRIFPVRSVGGADLAWIEGAECLMGNRYEQPMRTGRVDGFWIYRCQVTDWEYLFVEMG